MSRSDDRTFPSEWLPRPGGRIRPRTPRGRVLPWKDTFFVVAFVIAHDPKTNACVNMHLNVSANRLPDTRCAVGVSQGKRSVSQVFRENGNNSTKSVGNSQARPEIAMARTEVCPDGRISAWRGTSTRGRSWAELPPMPGPRSAPPSGLVSMGCTLPGTDLS